MARLNAVWGNFTRRGQAWDHFWQDDVSSSQPAASFRGAGSIVARATIPRAKTATLVDQFDTGTAPDTALWGAGNSGGTRTIDISAKTLRQSIGGASADCACTVAKTRFDLTDSYIFIAVTTPMPNIADANYLQEFGVATGSTIDGGNEIKWVLNGAGSFKAGWANDSGILNVVATLTFDAASYRWWRIRSDGTTCYWDTAPNGAAANPPEIWTNEASLALSSMTNVPPPTDAMPLMRLINTTGV